MKKIKIKKNVIKVLLIFLIIFSLSICVNVYAVDSNVGVQSENNAIEGSSGGTLDNRVNFNTNTNNANQTDGMLDGNVSNTDDLGNNELNNLNNEIETDAKEHESFTTVGTLQPGVSDESLSMTNLLLIILISLNIVLLILAVVVLMQAKKRI